MNIDQNVASSTPNFPVSQLNFSLEIKGNKTEIIISSYEDHVMVIATQIGAMGTILHASLSGVSKPLVLSLGLKDHSAGTLKGIVSAVIDKRLW
ncbi:hypothetical protein KIW84_052601 [Lathyrus oleraceus]|uniref:Proteasome assembly chaperone 3 n=1 Tax=Pisum sativum TaxID=3888 RepID=A0A9D4WP58_PEA|nr:hypothetical protein KIW84_052601 [Pisum sativum]